jgi:uncharacterized repeat protein (TIGR01451 family)
VTVVDTLPDGVSFTSGLSSQGSVTGSNGTVTADLGDLAHGAQASVTITVTVDPAARGTLVNEAVVSGNETETVSTNNRDSVTTQVDPRIDLAIDKLDSPDPVVAGEQLVYTLVVDNHGPSDATGVSVVDELPGGLSFVSATSSQGSVADSGGTITADLGDLAAGAQATVTITVDVDPAAQGTLVNITTVSGNETETNLQNNRDEEPTETETRVDLVIFKADSPDPVLAGEQLTYTLSIVNNGPSDATGVTAVDSLPAGVTFESASSTQGSVSHTAGTVTASLGPLGGGESATVTIVVTVDPAARGTLENSVSVTGNETETNPVNNRDDEPSEVQARIDLQVTKTDSDDPVTAGDPLTYTVTVTNNGPSQATGVVLTDTLPDEVAFVSASSAQGSVSHAGGVVTVSLGNLDVGQSTTVTIVAQVHDEAAGTITNRAEVQGNEAESNLDNNTALEPTAVDELLSSLSGAVYVDRDRDGNKDPDETWIPGVVVRLFGVDASGNPVELETSTDANGAFRFENLTRGTYRLVEEQPTRYLDGLETVGTLAAETNRNDEFSGIELPAGVHATDYLFGEHVPVFSKRRFLSSR